MPALCVILSFLEHISVHSSVTAIPRFHKNTRDDFNVLITPAAEPEPSGQGINIDLDTMIKPCYDRRGRKRRGITGKRKKDTV